MRAAFEFRHDSWLTDEVYRAARRHAASALCIADFGDKTTPVRPTARHGYFRLRDEGYTPADLERWADAIAEHGGDWDDVFVYFKHEDEGKGPEFARAFLEILAQRAVSALDDLREKRESPSLRPVAVIAPVRAFSRRSRSGRRARSMRTVTCGLSARSASRELFRRHERIVRRREDQRRNANPIGHAQRAGLR